MRLVDQWRRIADELPAEWAAARLLLRAEDDRSAARGAGLLAPLFAGRSGSEVRFIVARRGPGPRPETVLRLLWRLDRERIAGALEVLEVTAGRAEDGHEALADEPDAVARPSLAAAWEAAVEGLPPDWSDVYAEIVLRSSDQIAPAALLLAPVNPLRVGDGPVLRFRSARVFGYGASPEMVRRCLERLDADVIRGEVRILRALSATIPVATQGPVWYVGGRTV